MRDVALDGAGFEHLPRFERRVRVWYVYFVSLLHAPGVFEQFGIGERELVADAKVGAEGAREVRLGSSEADDREVGLLQRLAVEEVEDCVDGVDLVLLVGVELDLHDLGFFLGAFRGGAICFTLLRASSK